MKGEIAWFAKAAPGIPDNRKFLWLPIAFVSAFSAGRSENGNELCHKFKGTSELTFWMDFIFGHNGGPSMPVSSATPLGRGFSVSRASSASAREMPFYGC